MQYLVELSQSHINANSFESLNFFCYLSICLDYMHIFDKVLHIWKFEILALQTVDPPQEAGHF